MGLGDYDQIYFALPDEAPGFWMGRADDKSSFKPIKNRLGQIYFIQHLLSGRSRWGSLRLSQLLVCP